MDECDECGAPDNGHHEGLVSRILREEPPVKNALDGDYAAQAVLQSVAADTRREHVHESYSAAGEDRPIGQVCGSLHRRPSREERKS